MTQSKQLFDILEDSKSCKYRNIITGGQSLILYNYGPRGKWCLDSEENPEFERDRITYEKFMMEEIGGFSRMTKPLSFRFFKSWEIFQEVN